MHYLCALAIPTQYDLRVWALSSSLLGQVRQRLGSALVSSLKIAQDGSRIVDTLHSYFVGSKYHIERVEEGRSGDGAHVAKLHGSPSKDDRHRLAFAELIAAVFVVELSFAEFPAEVAHFFETLRLWTGKRGREGHGGHESQGDKSGHHLTSRLFFRVVLGADV